MVACKAPPCLRTAATLAAQRQSLMAAVRCHHSAQSPPLQPFSLVASLATAATTPRWRLAAVHTAARHTHCRTCHTRRGRCQGVACDLHLCCARSSVRAVEAFAARSCAPCTGARLCLCVPPARVSAATSSWHPRAPRSSERGRGHGRWGSRCDCGSVLCVGVLRAWERCVCGTAASCMSMLRACICSTPALVACCCERGSDDALCTPT